MADCTAKVEESEKKADDMMSECGHLGYADVAELYNKAANSFKFFNCCNHSPSQTRQFTISSVHGYCYFYMLNFAN